MKKVTITQINNNKFVVENKNTKVYILNKRMLKWNLTHTFKLKGEDVLAVMISIGIGQFDTITVDAA